MRTVVVVLILGFAGCTAGEDSPPTTDASAVDSSQQGTADAAVDGAPGQACTNAVYDPCTSASQCSSGNCKLFEQQAIQVCTQACTPGDSSTCPQQAGVAVTCNNMGICRPQAANSCTR
jgi:hypothetical protein